MRTLRLPIVALLLSAGCQKDPVVDHDGHPAPAGVLITVSMSGAQLDGLRAYAHAVRPGAEMALSPMIIDHQLASIVGASSLDALDLVGPIDVVVVSDAPGDGHAAGVALVAKIKDVDALTANAGAAKVETRDGWAIVGPAAVVGEIAPWAFSTLRTAARPSLPTAHIHLAQVLHRFHDELDTGRKAMHSQFAAQPDGARMTELMDAYLDGVMSIAHDIDDVRVTIDADAATASIDIAQVPKPGSRFAAFVAAQQPSTFPLLASLPATDGAAVVAGRFVAGPYRQPMLDLAGRMFGATEMIAATDELLKASTGELAVAWNASSSGIALVYLFGIGDAPAAQHAIAAMVAAFANTTVAMAGLGVTYKAVPGTTEHDGVQLTAYDAVMDLSKLPAAERAKQEAMFPTGSLRSYIGVFDNRGVIATGADSEAGVARAIDASRGKAPHYTPSADSDRLIGDARARKESMIVVADLAHLRALIPGAGAVDGVQAPALFALGFADHDAHLRIALPVSAVAALLPH